MPGERNLTPAPLPVWTEEPGLDNPAFEESTAADCTCDATLPGVSGLPCLSSPALPACACVLSTQLHWSVVCIPHHCPSTPCSSSWLQSRNKANKEIKSYLEEAGSLSFPTGTRYFHVCDQNLISSKTTNATQTTQKVTTLSTMLIK